MILHFLKILVFSKTYSFFKLIFRTNQFQQRPKYIFQKVLFYTSVSRTNSGLKALLIAAGQYLWSGFTFFTKTWFLGSGNFRIRKFQKSPWNVWIWLEYPASHSKSKFWRFFVKKTVKNQLQKFPQKNLFCLILWICLQPFFRDCRAKIFRWVRLNLHRRYCKHFEMVATKSRLKKDKLWRLYS